MCDAATIDLTRFVSPQGGTFSGKGVSGTTFDPATAGVGVATITYSVTINGCTSTTNKQVRVEALIPTVTFTAIPSQCAQGSPINLRDYTSTTLGAYTGNGIIGNLFSPSQGQVGANAVVLTVTSGTCQRTFNTSVTVAAAPAITFNDLPSSCTSAPVDLSRYVSPLGGTFSGVGVSGSIFNPATAGEGTATITYTLNVNGCSATSSKVATVNALLPVVTFADLGTVCQNGDPINLRSKVNVSSGTFSGSGVTGDYFYPSQATAGANEIIFRYGTGSCQLEVKKSISVSVVSPVTFATIPSICTDKAIDLSKFVNIAGGTFTGSGITGNSFSPGTAGIGEFPITYTFTNGSGCSATVGGTATVNALIQPFTLAAIEDVCKLGDPINLRSYTSTNEGTFTGSGVTGDLFDPSKATIGLNTVTLKVDQSGCAVSQSKTIKVVDAPAVTFNLPSDQCGTANISLTTLVNKQGGAFSGAGVTGSIFNPTTSGVGKFPITYTYSGTGCVTRVTREINVYDPIPSNITFSDIPSVCAQGSPVNLRALVNSAEGTFYGKGVVGDQLDPTKADVGVNEVTFSINRGTGCSLVLRKNVTVKAIPSVKFNAIPEICRDKPINLKRYVNMYGGTFAGSGVKDTLLYPASMPIGENTITYNYKEATTGCEYQFNQVVKVKAAMKDLAFSTIDNICSGIPRIDLSKQVNIQGGVFTTEEASAITSNFFSPTSSGIKTVKYMVDDNGCSQMASQTFEVYQTPALLFNYLPIQNTKVEIDLLNFVNISGGVFVGDGIAGTRFSPDKAGSGDHKITYTVTSSKGCSITKEQTIKVDNVIDFSGISVGTIPRLCANSEKVNLLPYVNPKNGTFSGQGVELGLYFNPQGRVGLNELKYTLTIGGNTYDKNLYINVDNDNSVKFLADTIKLCGGEGGVKSMVVNSTFDYTKSGDISLNGKYMAKGYSTQPYEVVSLAGCSTFKNFIINNAWVDPIDFSASTKVTTEGGLLKFTPSKSVDGLQTKWTFGDGGWSGEKTPSYYFYQTGMFNISLCITNAGGCQYQVNKDGYVNVSSDGAKFSAIMVGGKTFKAAMIASKPEVTQVKVYPNPFNTYINLMLPSELEGKDNEYNILTSMGMLVKSGKVRTSGQLDLSSLQLGVYILRINNQLIKLIKNE